MSDLVTRLRAALDTEEAAAHAAAAVCGCHPEMPSWSFKDDEDDGRITVDNDPHPQVRRKLGRRWNGSYEGLFTARHIARHDPAFVLADIAAKRKIIDLHEPTPGWDGRLTDRNPHRAPVCAVCADYDRDGLPTGDPYPCATVRLLAEAYGITDDDA